MTAEQHSTTDTISDGGVRVLVYMHHGVTRVNIEEIKLTRQEDMEDFSRQVIETIERINHPHVVISFETVRLICSRLLGEVARLNKKITAKGGKLKLACVSEDIRKVFSITGLDRDIKIYNNVAAATKSFRLLRILQFLGGPQPSN